MPGRFPDILAHVKEYEKTGCVVAVQVENEPGIHAAPRDYSEAAEKLFQAELPAEVSEFVLEGRDAVATTVWQEAGAVRNGNWRAFFGNQAEEFFSAYYFAKYVEQVAAAGKQCFDIPLYVNVWVWRRRTGFRVSIIRAVERRALCLASGNGLRRASTVSARMFILMTGRRIWVCAALMHGRTIHSTFRNRMRTRLIPCMFSKRLSSMA